MDGDLTETTSAVGEESHWIPLTDLMTGLMVIFLLIAVSYMMQVEADSARIKNVAIAYSEIKDALFEDLNQEFQADLPRWKAQLLKTDLTIRFSEPEVLFAPGSSELKPEFQAILADFFPRYVRILTSKKYHDSISEVRIEGHTSSVWNGSASPEQAYFLNMELSQARTRSTLAYVMSLPADHEQVTWLRRFVTANGLSSSRLILDDKGEEDVSR
jgi:outer membrane protein OmpA-like peptidoglycan-associated protein